MKTRTREIAKAGIFGSLDNPTIVTEKDLREIAETFTEIKTAPVRLGGHFANDRPRLANVTSVSYNEKTKTLTGTIQEQDALADAVDLDGYYPDVSIGAKQRASDGKMYLHHLAYLGDEAPAVKNLEQSLAQSLSAAEISAQKNIAAADSADKTAVRIYPALTSPRLYLSDTPVQQTCNPLNTYTTGTGENPAAAPAQASTAAGTSPAPQILKEESMTEEEIAALKAENESLKEKNALQEKLLSDTNKQAFEADKNALKKAVEGKLPQEAQEKLLALCDSIGSSAEKKLSLSDGASAVSILADIFNSLPQPVAPGELNLSDCTGITGSAADTGKAAANLSRRMMAAL